MAKLITMKQKENGQYVNLYPQTDWSQVNGADAQITTVNNSVDVKVANLQGQINQKQDASTAINQENLATNVGNFTGKWVTLTNKRITTTNVSPTTPETQALVPGTSLKGIVAIKQVTTLYTLHIVNNSSNTPYFYIYPFGATLTAPDTYGTYVDTINRTFTSFGYLVNDVCGGFSLNETGSYPQPTTALRFMGSTGSSDGEYNVLQLFSVNPTTYQLLHNVSAFAARNLRGDDFKVDMQVVIYGLKVTQGDFPTL